MIRYRVSSPNPIGIAGPGAWIPGPNFGLQTPTHFRIDLELFPKLKLENYDLEITSVAKLPFTTRRIEIIVRVKKNFNFSKSKIADFEMKLTHFETVD